MYDFRKERFPRFPFLDDFSSFRMRFSGFHFFSMVQIIKRYGFVVYPINRRPVCTNQIGGIPLGRATQIPEIRAASITQNTDIRNAQNNLVLSLTCESSLEQDLCHIGLQHCAASRGDN
jgi:hypothetical protein